jgi:hypothetical protein
VKLRARLGLAPTAPATPAPRPAARLLPVPGSHAPVPFSADVARVLGLPRRDLATTWTAGDVAELEARLRKPPGPCRCADFARPCPTRLLPTQARALLEAPRTGGLLAPIGVGHGKTLVDLLLPMVMQSKTAVLLIPANLRAQLLERDWDYYGAHWHLPNLAGGRWFQAGRPALHVLTYSKLSTQEGTNLLTRIKPDLLICDEAHNLRDRRAARTVRFLRYFRQAEGVRLCALSGTLTSKSIRDYAHLAELALRDGSPLPLHPPTVEEWASAIDPSEAPADAGALRRFCDTGEHVRDGFRRRRNDTPGVVATDESALGTSLVIRERKVDIPQALHAHIATVLEDGVRPDGEELVERLQQVACARQLASGFFHRWRYPRGEPLELITEWFGRRQAWNRELRQRLQHPREHLDSPGLLLRAALRAYQEPAYEGELPVWRAKEFEPWHEIHRQVQPVPEAVWLDESVVNDAAAWARETPGIVWVEFPELGERIARAAGVPWYGGGPEASTAIALERGARSIVASIRAHGTGKNLQTFSRNLVANPPADGGAWEQLLGRTHRQGQTADEVTVDLYLHTDELRRAWDKAREYALFIQQTEGQPQKLCLASWAD